MQYLKDKSYYADIYDWHTVQECRRFIKRIVNDKKFLKKWKSSNKEKRIKLEGYMINLPLYFIKGNRYIHKKEFIDNCMGSDRKKDEYIEKTPEPVVFCPKCNKRMEFMVKDLESDLDDKNLRMFFLFRCDSCNEKKGLYDNGEPYIFKSDFCPKCHQEWEQKHIKSKDKVTTKSYCNSCGHKEEYILDFNEKIVEDKPDVNFEKDRKEFCLSETEGEEYRHTMTYDLPQFKELVDKWEEKEKNKNLYDAVAKLKKLNLTDLEKFLAKPLEKAGYTKLDLSKPEIGKDIVVSFIVQDTKSRESYDSEKTLRKILKESLAKTNWRLMSEGVNCRLGILSGRLRGYEHEEDLLKLIGKQNEKTRTS